MICRICVCKNKFVFGVNTNLYLKIQIWESIFVFQEANTCYDKHKFVFSNTNMLRSIYIIIRIWFLKRKFEYCINFICFLKRKFEYFIDYICFLKSKFVFSNTNMLCPISQQYIFVFGNANLNIA